MADIANEWFDEMLEQLQDAKDNAMDALNSA